MSRMEKLRIKEEEVVEEEELSKRFLKVELQNAECKLLAGVDRLLSRERVLQLRRSRCCLSIDRPLGKAVALK